MSAYIIVRVTVRDKEAYQEYMQHTPRVISQFGGKMIVRGGAIETLEGPEETQRIVVIEFPSMEQAKAFYTSPDYQKAKALREGAGEGQFIAVAGYPESEWQTVVEESNQISFER
ncbi:MAG: hypothetical protein ACI8T1_003752 [Verrucomicrobiales bacterium]|jgi:uncharacterized protein (DUF1330 family)